MKPKAKVAVATKHTKPPWDDTNNDLTVFRATKDEIRTRKLQRKPRPIDSDPAFGDKYLSGTPESYKITHKQTGNKAQTISNAAKEEYERLMSFRNVKDKAEEAGYNKFYNDKDVELNFGKFQKREYVNEENSIEDGEEIKRREKLEYSEKIAERQFQEAQYKYDIPTDKYAYERYDLASVASKVIEDIEKTKYDNAEFLPQQPKVQKLYTPEENKQNDLWREDATGRSPNFIQDTATYDNTLFQNDKKITPSIEFTTMGQDVKRMSPYIVDRNDEDGTINKVSVLNKPNASPRPTSGNYYRNKILEPKITNERNRVVKKAEKEKTGTRDATRKVSLLKSHEEIGSTSGTSLAGSRELLDTIIMKIRGLSEQTLLLRSVVEAQSDEIRKLREENEQRALREQRQSREIETLRGEVEALGKRLKSSESDTQSRFNAVNKLSEQLEGLIEVSGFEQLMHELQAL